MSRGMLVWGGFFLLCLLPAAAQDRMTAGLTLSDPSGGAGLAPTNRTATLLIGDKVPREAPTLDGDLPAFCGMYEAQAIGGDKGNGSASGPAFTITSSGNDIWGKSDQCYFMSSAVAGDFSMICRVVNFNSKNEWGKVGIMCRESDAAGSPFVAMLSTEKQPYHFEWRGKPDTDAGGGSSGKSAYPCLLKLERIGNKFRGYYAPEGQKWTEIGNGVDIKLPIRCLLGFTVSSHDNKQRATARVEVVSGRGIATVRGDAVQFVNDEYRVLENAKKVVVKVSHFGGAPGEVTVPWSTRSGTATDGKDYTGGKGTLSWGRDDTAAKEISIPIIDNTEENKERTFSVSLGPPTGGAVLGRPNQAMVTILDDDGPGYVRFENPMYSVLEPEKFAKINVVREAGRRGKITVVCSLAGGSAKAGVNYKETTQTLTWNDGDTKPKTLLVPMIWPDRTIAGGGGGNADDILSVKADPKKKDEPTKKADPKKKDTGKEEE